MGDESTSSEAPLGAAMNARLLPLPFAWFMVVTGALLFTLGVLNWIWNPDNWPSSLVLVVLMPFSMWVGVTHIRRRHRSGN